MKKIILASVAGLLLVAGQAAATTQASARIGDRVGAQSGESSDVMGLPIPLLVVGSLVALAVVVQAVDDDGESD